MDVIPASAELSSQTSVDSSPGGDQMPAKAIRQALRNMPAQKDDGVSVLMSTYNAMPYLPAAVDSILNQTHRDFEFVIVDDGSTDATRDYLNTLDDPRIKMIRQPNRGTSIAANVGLLNCSHRWVARMDADDRCEPERLASLVARVQQQPNLVLLGSAFRYFGPHGQSRKVAMPSEHDDIVEALLRGDHGLAHGTCLIDANRFRSLGGYWEFPFFEDWDAFLRMSEVGHVANLTEPLYQYRANFGSLSSTRTTEMRLYYQYAIDAAQRRRQQQTAISFSDFKKAFRNQPFYRQASHYFDALSLSYYRYAMGCYYGGLPIKGAATIALAACLNPRRAVGRIAKMGAA